MIKPILLTAIFCFVFLLGKSQKTYNEVTLPQLLNRLEKKDTNMIVVDVRTPGEYYDSSSTYQQSNIGRIKGAINIPLQDFRKNPSTIHRLDVYKDKDIYVICSHSYRSRVVSTLLVDSGFQHINNTRGGMTEFFRRYNDIKPFKNNLYETSIHYTNISPSQLMNDFTAGKNPLLIAVSNTPRYFWDSANVIYYKYFPSFKNAINFTYADSLQILELVKKEKNRPVVLYNTVNYGAAELAGWLTGKGISNVSYLVGGIDLFYAYIKDENLSEAKKYMRENSKTNFITPVVFCNQFSSLPNAKLIDVRPDSMFNKITKGIKYNYMHLKNAINFFEGNGVQKFEQKFPDKKLNYVLISANGIDGLEFADKLADDGYHISWIIDGMQRWEWYMNNVETFKCMDYLVK